MSKKRRMFEIEMPEDVADPAPPTKAPTAPSETARRGPMAAAISETMDSQRDRQSVEAEIRKENDALAHEHVRLKRAGLVLETIPLEKIDTSKLVRDRITGDDLELQELTASIAALGLSNPIQVEETAAGRYELIQGYRRLQAFKALLAETGDAERFGAIPAAVSPLGQDVEQLYRKMVDENLVRKDISFAEMAQLAVAYAADPRTTTESAEKAVAVLFQSASYQKRSYIRSFIGVMERLEKHLRFPAEMPRALGLALAREMEADPTVPRRIAEDLKDWENRSVEDELGVLRRFAKADKGVETGVVPAPKPKPAAKSRTSFQFNRPEGRARCVAGDGLIEVRVDRDFSSLDRQRLERAVNAFLDTLMG